MISSHPKVLLESNLILCNGFKLRTSQEALQEKKVQILCRCVSVDSTVHVFADMNLKGSIPLMIMSVRFVGHKKKGNQNRKR